MDNEQLQQEVSSLDKKLELAIKKYAIEEHQVIRDEIKILTNEFRELSKTLKPMVETYMAALKIGKWMSAIAVFISIGIGIVLALKDLFKK